MIRHRLLAAIVTATAAVLVLTGVGVVNVLEDRLVATVDGQLTEFATQRPLHAFTTAEHERSAGALDDRHMAIVQLDPDGTVRTAIPAGPTDTPMCRTAAGGWFVRALWALHLMIEQRSASVRGVRGHAVDPAPKLAVGRSPPSDRPRPRRLGLQPPAAR